MRVHCLQLGALAVAVTALIGHGATFAVPAPSVGPPPNPQAWSREIIPMLRLGPAARAWYICPKTASVGGAFHASVSPSLGVAEAGLTLNSSSSVASGICVSLGGNPGVGGFAVKTSGGRPLWEDRFAPWVPYQAYVLEAVVERGRVRAQMLEADGKTLISQSPWLSAPEALATSETFGSLFAHAGMARFWGWGRTQTPLAALTDDAPNKRRLVQDEKSPWLIVGPGNWMWTAADRKRIRQAAVVERSSAIDRTTSGSLRQWECRVKPNAGAGGAGMLFQTNEKLDQGFIAWLGGTFGAGSLMLYRLPGECLWSGAQDNWHYDTEYLVRAETRPGQVRAQLFRADGQTLVQETPWVSISDEESKRSGFLGFQTWLGTAEFSGFSAGTAVAAQSGEPRLATTAQSVLGPGWTASGDGTWSETGSVRGWLRQTDSPHRALALNTTITGIMGKWRCRAKVAPGTEAAGLVFQAAPDGQAGFACLLTGTGLRLESLAGKTLWESAGLQWTRDTEYVLEGEVMVDRVAVRLYAADGKTLLAECPAVYVPEANNRRTGSIGALVRGGSAEFAAWELR
jgi:hypothetical protein